MQLRSATFLARFLQVMPQQDVSVSSGAINLKTHLVQKQETQSMSGPSLCQNLAENSEKLN